jgi:hypothetical protein
MTSIIGRNLAGALAAALTLVTLLFGVGPAHAQAETIRLVSSTVTNEFPEGFRFDVEVKGEEEIASVLVRLKIGLQARTAYDYLEGDGGITLPPAKEVKGSLFWRTNVRGRYIPPGTIVTYHFEIEDSKGTQLKTVEQQFIYYDARFEWKEVSEGPVVVAYHGPVKTRADTVLDAITQTFGTMGPLLGAGIAEPIRVTMYNNVKEMLEALPLRSAAVGRELITEGQAFTRVGTLLVLGGGRMARGTASHEVTHILVHRAGDSIIRAVPSWLGEGLAEYANVDPAFAYETALEFAVATDRLQPLAFMQNLPGDPEDVIIFYGQARSVVRLMIDRFGAEKMNQLMAVLKDGKRMDDALQQVYGFNQLELDNLWRATVGAPEYVATKAGRARPTPLPRIEVLPYSLTPQPQSETIEARADISTPTPTPSPTPLPTATPSPSPTETPATTVPEPSPEPEKPAATGVSCNAVPQGAGALDLSTAAILFGLVGLAFRRRSKK